MQAIRPLLLAFLLSPALLTSCVTSGSGGGPEIGGGSSINDTARYLGGLPGSNRGDLALPRGSAEWKAHASRMDRLWSVQSGRQTHIGGFRKELGLFGNGTIFYPFGGPDHLHAASYFPGAGTYILVGLEGAETMPELSTLSSTELSRGLNGIAHSLRTVTEASYFVTTEMRADLGATPLRGTLPLLLAQIARDGKSVSSVEAVALDSSGHLIPRSSGSACPGWHIRAGGKNIFYFRQDLSNGGLGDRRLLKFVSNRGGHTTFVKSASYLMHQGNFSTIRDYIVNNSRGIVQCPSGVPYRHLRDGGWNIKLHGNYRGASSPFTQYHQQDLAIAYAEKHHPVKPMTFGFGYLLDPKSTCVIVGHR
jgi:hypothetical protein